jgi:hypothetical protein
MVKSAASEEGNQIQ